MVHFYIVTPSHQLLLLVICDLHMGSQVHTRHNCSVRAVFTDQIEVQGHVNIELTL